MKNILIVGAGRSSSALIKYILEEAAVKGWFVTVADSDPGRAAKKIKNHPNGRAIWLDVTKPNDRRDVLIRTDLVISLLPAYLHMKLAKDCIELKKHLVTASYVSNEMYQLREEVRQANLIFMGEMGLDPGIDHMSAMKTIDKIKAQGGKITSFKTYTGGLIAPESDTNPWHYKFTWNPRNVVVAGQGTAQYMENGKYKYIPYNRLFKEVHIVDIPGMGPYEAYANRDSLLYRERYGLEDIPNILRGTLRHVGYSEAWDVLVELGLTDGSYPILNSATMTYFELMEAYINAKGGNIRERLANMMELDVEGEIMQKIEWLGLFKKKKIGLVSASPALILENLLLKKWRLKKKDKDMILMQHEFEYTIKKKKKKHVATMVMKGENSTDTAMSRLVGLPLGIFAKLIMEGKITATGVQIPVSQEVYKPVLEELKKFGANFTEQEFDM